MNKKFFSVRSSPQVKVTWRRVLEDERVIKSVLSTRIFSLTDGITKEWCIATHLIWQKCRQIQRKSGWQFLALYLKQCRTSLMRVVGDDSTPYDLSVFVSLTRSGIPRIIPSFHRQAIEGSQCYETVHVVIFCVQAYSACTTSTFSSIVTPADLELIQTTLNRWWIKWHIKPILDLYPPFLNTIPMQQGLEFRPRWKSVPTGAWYTKFLGKHGDASGRSLKPIAKKSIFYSFPYSLASILMTFVHSREEQFSQGSLWPP